MKSHECCRLGSVNRFGTVGAVALDKNGNIAAGTSTGGMTNKRYGRVGDAPIIGAGTYANNETCGVSATGSGEYFIRLGVARDICALMEYSALPVQAAADRVIKQKLSKLGGSGGIIAMDALMTVPGKKTIAGTTIIPIGAGLSSYESWPHPIVQLVLRNVHAQ